MRFRRGRRKGADVSVELTGLFSLRDQFNVEKIPSFCQANGRQCSWNCVPSCFSITPFFDDTDLRYSLRWTGITVPPDPPDLSVCFPHPPPPSLCSWWSAVTLHYVFSITWKLAHVRF